MGRVRQKMAARRFFCKKLFSQREIVHEFPHLALSIHTALTRTLNMQPKQ